MYCSDAYKLASRLTEADEVEGEASVSARFAQIIPKYLKPMSFSRSTIMSLE